MLPGNSSFINDRANGVPGYEPGNPISGYQHFEKTAGPDVPVVQDAVNLLLHNISKNELNEVRNYSEELNIKIEPRARRMIMQNLKQCVDLPVFFKSDVLRIVIVGRGYEPTIAEISRTLSEIMPILSDSGGVLAIGNHEWLKSADLW